MQICTLNKMGWLLQRTFTNVRQTSVNVVFFRFFFCLCILSLYNLLQRQTLQSFYQGLLLHLYNICMHVDRIPFIHTMCTTVLVKLVYQSNLAEVSLHMTINLYILPRTNINTSMKAYYMQSIKKKIYKYGNKVTQSSIPSIGQ